MVPGTVRLRGAGFVISQDHFDGQSCLQSWTIPTESIEVAQIFLKRHIDKKQILQ